MKKYTKNRLFFHRRNIRTCVTTLVLAMGTFKVCIVNYREVVTDVYLDGRMLDGGAFSDDPHIEALARREV